MHYFSLHAADGTHLGFLIMQPDDNPTNGGRFVAKPVDNSPPDFATQIAELDNYSQPLATQIWSVEKDGVTLFAEGCLKGHIRNEYLKLNGYTFILNDLTGAV